jgi:hypothetical protein
MRACRRSDAFDVELAGEVTGLIDAVRAFRLKSTA